MLHWEDPRIRGFVGRLPSQFAKHVRARRTNLGYSQEYVALQVNTLFGMAWHQTVLAKIENGDRAVKLDEAVALSAVLRIPLDDLIDGVGLGHLMEPRYVASEDGRGRVELVTQELDPSKPRISRENQDAAIARGSAEYERAYGLGRILRQAGVDLTDEQQVERFAREHAREILENVPGYAARFDVKKDEPDA